MRISGSKSLVGMLCGNLAHQQWTVNKQGVLPRESITKLHSTWQRRERFPRNALKSSIFEAEFQRHLINLASGNRG